MPPTVELRATHGELALARTLYFPDEEPRSDRAVGDWILRHVSWRT